MASTNVGRRTAILVGVCRRRLFDTTHAACLLKGDVVTVRSIVALTRRTLSSPQRRTGLMGVLQQRKCQKKVDFFFLGTAFFFQKSSIVVYSKFLHLSRMYQSSDIRWINASIDRRRTHVLVPGTWVPLQTHENTAKKSNRVLERCTDSCRWLRSPQGHTQATCKRFCYIVTMSQISGTSRRVVRNLAHRKIDW